LSHLFSLVSVISKDQLPAKYGGTIPNDDFNIDDYLAADPYLKAKQSKIAHDPTLLYC
jgi:hypothetical protein